MELKTKLAIIWIIIGVIQIVVARIFIVRKQDPFADPNFWLAKKWIKSMKKVEALADYAMDSNIIERSWLVNKTIGTMTKSGIYMILLGSIHFLSFGTTTSIIVLSSIGFITILSYYIYSFTIKCIAYSKTIQ